MKYEDLSPELQRGFDLLDPRVPVNTPWGPMYEDMDPDEEAVADGVGEDVRVVRAQREGLWQRLRNAWRSWRE